MQIGNQPGNGFSFQIDTASLKAGNLVPAGSFGPITLGFSDLRLDPVVLGGTITLGSFVNGHFVPAIAGTVNLAAGLPGFSAAASVSIAGTRTDLPSGATTYDVSGQLVASFNVGNGLVIVNNAALPFDIKITNTPSSASAINLSVVTTLTGTTIDSASVSFNDLFSLTTKGMHINFAPRCRPSLYYLRFPDRRIQTRHRLPRRLGRNRPELRRRNRRLALPPQQLDEPEQSNHPTHLPA